MRALLSTYDKTGIGDLAAGLHRLGWEIVSSGGTARTVAEAGVPVTDVADLTGVPAILGHRVVTLHPKVHGGLLADVSDPDHVADMELYGIEPIDLVVVNLYPFASDPSVEMIDIGGPALVRAAAKNHHRVGVVVHPADYDQVLAELGQHGSLSASIRRRLARKAFAHTATYDAAIVTWLDRDDPDPMPATIHLALERAQDLRYGENPHQQGARYRQIGATSWWDLATQHGGKQLSYLNLFDTEAAWRLVHSLGDHPAAAIIKHANPCGVAIAEDITTAYERAHSGDPMSAFGGIVAVNRAVPLAMAEKLAGVFTEVVVAPAYEPEALATLSAKKNLRVIEAQPPGRASLHVRSIDGGALVQEPDAVAVDRAAWRVVTRTQPSPEQWRDLELAWRVCAAVSSNTIVLVAGGQAVGIGAGQQSRVDAAEIAARKADGRAKGGAAASDAFFPFRDGLDVCAGAGVAAVIQPGGSVNDDEVIAAADEQDLIMVLTGERHFRH